MALEKKEESAEEEKELMRSMCNNRKEWVVLVATPFQGHFTPMLQLGSILHAKGFSILVAYPEFYSVNPPQHPDFMFLPLPHPLSHTQTALDDMLSAIAVMNSHCIDPMVSFLNKIMKDEDLHGRRILCVIYDWLMNFGESVATQLKIPSIILRTSSAAYTHSYHAIFRLEAENRIPLSECELEDTVPGLHHLRFRDLATELCSKLPDIVLEFFASVTNTRSSVGVIWNTIEDLEHTALKQNHQHCKVPFFQLGPLHKMAPKASTTSFLEEDTNCLKWLDKQAHESVIYISLGSSSFIDKQELKETASALANSGQPFLWVVRPSSVHGSNWIEDLPEGFQELIGDRGQIVKWAPQKQVLAHPAVGGFLSHCGWNSTLESIGEAVPIICRPYFADQMANARYITQVWEVGLELEHVKDRREVESAIRRLMVDDEGKEIRQRVNRLKLKLDASVQKGGSSYKSLNDLTNFILSQWDKVSTP